MPQAALYLAVAALAYSVYSSEQQRKVSKEQLREQKEAGDKQTAMQQGADAESKRQEARKARIARARVQQQARNLGSYGSSGEAGALSAITTQTAASSAFLTGSQLSVGSIQNNVNKAADYGYQTNVWGARSNLSMSIFQASGGFNTLFSGAGGGTGEGTGGEA